MRLRDRAVPVFVLTLILLPGTVASAARLPLRIAAPEIGTKIGLVGFPKFVLVSDTSARKENIFKSYPVGDVVNADDGSGKLKVVNLLCKDNHVSFGDRVITVTTLARWNLQIREVRQVLGICRHKINVWKCGLIQSRRTSRIGKGGAHCDRKVSEDHIVWRFHQFNWFLEDRLSRGIESHQNFPLINAYGGINLYPRSFSQSEFFFGEFYLLTSSIGGALRGSRTLYGLAGLNPIKYSDHDYEEKGYALNVLLYRFAGFALTISGGIALLYVWRKMNLDLALNMHLARYTSLLFAAAVVIAAGLLTLIFHYAA